MRKSHDRTEILEYIRSFTEKNGDTPTMGEIQRGLGISSKSVVNYHLGVLEREGHIKKIASCIVGSALLVSARRPGRCLCWAPLPPAGSQNTSPTGK